MELLNNEKIKKLFKKDSQQHSDDYYYNSYYSLSDLSFTTVEALKLLRTNLNFSLVNDGCKVIGITSPNRAEAKSTLALNLAEVISDDNKRVILIDGDMRLPSINTKLGIRPTNGLSDILSNQGSTNNLIIKVQDKNFSIISVGQIPPNPSELIGSDRMGILINKLREYYDYIIIDLPPVNVVSDALAVSNFVDGFLMAVRENRTEKKELKEALNKLKLVDGRVIGTVLTFDTALSKTYKRKYKYNKYNKYSKYKYYSYDKKKETGGGLNEKVNNTSQHVSTTR